MSSKPDDRNVPDHPGIILKQALQALNLPKARIARMLILSRQCLHEILAGNQSITPSVSLRVAKLTGTRPEMWLDLQQAYDLALARSKCGHLLHKVSPLEERW